MNAFRLLLKASKWPFSWQRVRSRGCLRGHLSREHLALHAGADSSAGDVVAAVGNNVPGSLGVAERANVLTLASVNFLDELLHGADTAQAALDEVKDGRSALDVVLFTELATAAAEGVVAAEAAQEAVAVKSKGNSAAVHAGTAVPAGAETGDAAVAATVEKAEGPALLAAEEGVVSLSRAADHPFRLELDVHIRRTVVVLRHSVEGSVSANNQPETV